MALADVRPPVLPRPRPQPDRRRQRVGFLFALLAFALSVVSFPLLLDRNVGMAMAIVTSIRAILKNPFIMALWGVFVAGARRSAPCRSSSAWPW